MKINLAKYGALGLVIVTGAAILGLVIYSYFEYDSGSYLPPISEVATSELVTRTSRGEYLDKRAEAHPEIEAPELGYRAPDLVLSDFEGHDVRLSRYRGTPVLLNFWATWCPPCRAEMPDLQAFHERYGGRIVVLGVNWNDDLSDARAFLEEYGVTYPNLIDRQGKAFVKYRLTGLPTSFWIDEQGVIRGVWYGAMTTATMVQGFERTTRALDGGR